MKRQRAPKIRIAKPAKAAPAPAASKSVPPEAEPLELLQRSLGNASFAHLLASAPPGSLVARLSGGAVKQRGTTTTRAKGALHRPSRARPGQAGASVSQIQRAPGRSKGPAAPKAEDLIAARYPHLVGVLEARQLKTVQNYIDWRVHAKGVSEEAQAYDKRALEQGRREGYDDPRNVRFLSDYQEGLDKIYAKEKPAPDVLMIEVDTIKLLDRTILADQPWNVAAEKDFRDRWFSKLASKPTTLDLGGEHPLEQVFRGFYWGNETFLPNEGGLVTWPKLMEIESADKDYSENVRNGPFVKAVRDAYDKVSTLHSAFTDEYFEEVDRKLEFPHVSWVAEHLSSEIDMAAAAQFLPPGKKFDDMDPFEVMRFLAGLTQDQMKQVSTRVLPSMDDWVKVDKDWLEVGFAYGDGKYEAALMGMMVLADEVGQNLQKVRGYRQRVNEGASVAVKTLVIVREACHLALTIMGGVVGGKLAAGGSRLLGVALGSAGGAGGSTALFEAASQWSEGNLDPGAILWKGGKDAVITFITTYIGGGLAEKFKGVLLTRLGEALPKLSEGVRELLAARLADVTSGALTAPVGIVVDGMLGGDWPTTVEDLCDRVAKAAAFQAAMGQTMDVFFGGGGAGQKELAEGQKLLGPGEGQTERSAGGGGGGGDGNPFADLSAAEIDAALKAPGEAGTAVRGPAGEQTGQSLMDMEVVSRLNDEVRALVAGRGVAAAPEAGPEFERSETEVALAQQVLENPNSPPEAINQALEVIVERAVADFRARWPHSQAELGAGIELTADTLRGACGPGRDITADSVASFTIESETSIILHRIQASHLEIGARHSFSVAILPDGTGFIIDPTFAQFADQIGGRTFSAEAMLSEPGTAETARDLLRDGFVPLTPETAYNYALGLGAQPDQANAVAARIMSGDASVLTEVIANGEVTRMSTRPGEAYNTMTLPVDVDTPSSGSVAGLDRILARLPATDPIRPMLASLRDRLLFMSTVQPPVTGAGVGARPGGGR